MEDVLRILHLEDDPVDTELVLRTLRADGLAAALDRVDSLAAFREALGRPYVLILSDYALPNTDPMEALALVRQVRPDLPFIFLSGTMGEEVAIETLKLGATDYVLKQRMGRLAPAVRRALKEATDQAQRRRIEETLRAKEAEIELILNRTPFMLTRCGRDLRYRYVSGAYAKMLGRTPEQIAGQPIVDVMGEEGFRTIQPHVEAVLQGQTVHYETDVPFAGVGSRFLSVSYEPDRDERGQVIGWIASILDLTERRWMEAALRTSEERYRTLFEAIDEGFCIIEVLFDEIGRPVDYRFLETNPAFEKQTGLTQVQGRRILELSPGHETHWFEIYGKIALTGEPARFERRAERLQHWYDVYAFRFGPPEARQVAVLFNNITGRKRMEEELRQNAERLLEADRRKDQFLAMLAHELRNPLAPVRYAAQMLCLGELPGQMKKQCEMIDRQVSHMGRLLDDLLDVSRITQGKIQLKREKTDLRTVIEQAIEGMRAIIEGRGQYYAFKEPGIPLPIEGDPTRLEQVVRNLLHNANKYTEEGGCIGISVELEAENDHPGRAVIRVCDSGVGIDPEILEHIFEPFVQAEQSLARTQGGLGIGLAMVRNLVQLHGGSVEVHSAGTGCGSEFIVRLPLAETGGVEVRAACDAGSPAGSCRVLVVDDNVDAAASLSELLELWGHEVRTAFDGPHALGTAREWRPEIVLLDIGLPGMDGYEVAQNLRREPATARTCLVALTGYGAEEDRRRSQEAGFDDHLTKPVELERLQGVLHHCRAA